MSWFPRCFFQESWDGSSKVGNPAHSFRFFRAKPSTSSEWSSPIRNSKVKSEKINHLDQLKRADVEKWAGRVIYKRGDAYHRSGRVEKPAMTADGALIAWVLGSQKYATLVEVESGDLCSLCTCPYDDSPPCKHAVALLLEYMEAKEKNRPIPAASPSDKRIAVIDDLLLTSDLEDEGDDEEAEDEPSVCAPGARGKNRSSESDVNRFLSGLTKEELIGLIGEWSARFPEIADELAHRGRLSAGNTGALAAAIRREIAETTSQDAWYDHWRNEGSIPDYSRLKLRLGDLLDAGAADEVVRLGALLLERGGRQVETSDDEGDTASEIASCMEVVFQALSRTTMPAADRMMWAIDADLKDSFDLCEGSQEFWGRQEYAAADWSVVADNLLKRLGSMNPSASKDGFSYDYARNQLADWIIRALENAKRINEIIPLCEREAETTGSYVRLVQRLIDKGREEDAEHWCRRGIQATTARQPGIAHALRTSLREIREKKGDWLAAAAFRTEEFLDHPSLETFQTLEKAARRAKVHPQVRNAVLGYLETGRPPGEDGAWPLPETATAEKPLHPRQSRQFPMVSTLIDIAIAEKRPDEALRWYDFQKVRQPHGHIHDENRLAGAVAERYPDRAAALWKGLAERQIALTQPKAYREAVLYLGKIREVLEGKGEGERFTVYLRELRNAHIRKKRLIELLDDMRK